jgi:hypothetical protein
MPNKAERKPVSSSAGALPVETAGLDPVAGWGALAPDVAAGVSAAEAAVQMTLAPINPASPIATKDLIEAKPFLILIIILPCHHDSRI